MKAFAFQAIGIYKESDKASTLKERDHKDATDLITTHGGGDLKNGKMQKGGDDLTDISNMETVVRRLTPLECERLQGLPDNWTLVGEQDENGEWYYTDEEGKKRKITDSARYRALGNAMATPYWRYLARKIVSQYEHEVTMGSLFDGIGCFPYVFQQCGCTPVWASEVEPYCIAVTKAHFPEMEQP